MSARGPHEVVGRSITSITTITTLALLASLAACTAPTGLTIDARTDFRPGADFASVQTEVSETPFLSPAPNGALASRPVIDADYTRGVRVDERSALPAGDWYVRVTLLAASGARVAQRTVSVHFSGRYALTVVLARSCTGVVCPTPSEPTSTECSGGTCVSPTCSPETPEECPTPDCVADSDCGSPGPCARATCAAGVCLFAADDAVCGMAGACGADFRCTASGDAGMDDARVAVVDAAEPLDAPPPSPSFTLRRLPRGGTAWSELTPLGDFPTDEVEAAFAQLGTDEMVVLTRTELFVFRLSSLTFIERRSRDAVFPELAGIAIQGASIVGTDIFIHSRDAWLYVWSNAARTASLTQFVRYEDLGADWRGPLTPPWWRLYAMFYVPDNADGWAHVDPLMLCGGTVNNHLAYLSTDGFGPRGMITTVYDGGCSQFVDQSLYGDPDYGAFALPGAPPSPWEIDAAEWYDGLWAFTSPE